MERQRDTEVEHRVRAEIERVLTVGTGALLRQHNVVRDVVPVRSSSLVVWMRSPLNRRPEIPFEPDRIFALIHLRRSTRHNQNTPLVTLEGTLEGTTAASAPCLGPF